MDWSAHDLCRTMWEHSGAPPWADIWLPLRGGRTVFSQVGLPTTVIPTNGTASKQADGSVWHALTRIMHQPLGASPRFRYSSDKPDASAFRLICAVFWAG